jgi:hypothetical protein
MRWFDSMTGKNRRPQAPVVTQAQLERAKRALTRDGTQFAGYRVWPDGRVDVLAGEPLKPGTQPGSVTDEVEAWKKEHGYA